MKEGCLGFYPPVGGTAPRASEQCCHKSIWASECPIQWYQSQICSPYLQFFISRALLKSINAKHGFLSPSIEGVQSLGVKHSYYYSISEIL